MQNSWYFFGMYLASCVVPLLMQRVAVNLKALLCHQNEVGNCSVFQVPAASQVQDLENL